MSFYRYFKIFTLFLAVLIGYSGAAKTGKVTYRNGEAYLNAKNDDNMINIGNKVRQGDQVMTMYESQVIIALPDGSKLTVEENTHVIIKELSFENDKNVSTTEVKKGKISFDVQKQNGSESSIKFRTGTATAAIRGTNGTLAVTSKGKTFASLNNGKLDINYGPNGNKLVSINGGQAALPIGDEYIILDLNASEDPTFFETLDTLLNDTTLTADSLTKLVLAQDSIINSQNNELKKSINCTLDALPDTLFEPKVSTKGHCDEGTDSVEIGGIIKKASGEFTHDLNWATSAAGPKKFAATCYSQGKGFLCGQLETYYNNSKASDSTEVQDSLEVQDTTAVIDSLVQDSVVQDTVEAEHIPLTITSSSPIMVCDPAAATVEGLFDPKDPKAILTVTIGNQTSPNLAPRSANGQFVYTVTINDKKNNWNETKAVVEYRSEKYGNEKQTIELNVDKTCKNVNLARPVISLQRTDSLKCQADISLTSLKDDQAIYKAVIDGTPTAESYLDKDSYFTQKLTSGLHSYVFEAVDQAGNKSQVKKTLGCYPPMSVGINVSGGTYERLRVPPPPGNISTSFHRVLRFKVIGIPQNDPIYIKRISITQDNKPTINLYPTDFQSTSFDQQIELTRGKNSNVKIEVVMKNGKMLSVTKTYEVH